MLPKPSNSTRYAYTMGGGVLMHRLLMSPPMGMVVDHLNEDGLDNRRSNLEVVTQAENLRRYYERKRKREQEALSAAA